MYVNHFINQEPIKQTFQEPCLDNRNRFTFRFLFVSNCLKLKFRGNMLQLFYRLQTIWCQIGERVWPNYTAMSHYQSANTDVFPKMKTFKTATAAEQAGDGPDVHLKSCCCFWWPYLCVNVLLRVGTADGVHSCRVWGGRGGVGRGCSIWLSRGNFVWSSCWGIS